uniref:Uncharacterized protein n=1 Tax=Junco hyemalis TaxID=40217 RepID=A0A8C5NPU3_JUNHY
TLWFLDRSEKKKKKEKKLIKGIFFIFFPFPAAPPHHPWDAPHPTRRALRDAVGRGVLGLGVSFAVLGGLFPSERSRWDVPAAFDDSLLFLSASPRGSCFSQQCGTTLLLEEGDEAGDAPGVPLRMNSGFP